MSRTLSAVFLMVTANLVVAAGCTPTITEPIRVPVPEVPFDVPPLHLPFAGRVEIRLPGTSTRIRDPESENLDPYSQSLAESRRSANARLLRYHEAFARLAEGFTDGVFRDAPGNGEPGLTAVLQLVRMLYDRKEKSLQQVLSLEVRSQEGHVLFRAATQGSGLGDPRDSPEVVIAVMRQALERLAGNVNGRRDEIVGGIAAHRDVQRTLDGLLAPAIARGRSPQQNRDDRGKRFALVVGISDYADDRWKLKYGARDARLVFEALNDPDNKLNYQDDRIVLLEERAASASAIRNALQLWLAAEVGSGDTVFVYFAGHGAFGPAPAGGQVREKYFFPADFRDQPDVPDEVDAMNGIPMEDIRRELAKLSARNVVMVFDACHAGAARKNETNELDRFVDQNRKTVTAIVAAAQSHQKSIDGLFTPHLVQKLRGDPGNDGRPRTPLVKLGALVQHLLREVPAGARDLDSGIEQFPDYRVNDVSRFSQLEISDWRVP